MKDKYCRRIKKVVEDKDGNLVVAIMKYKTMECLFHSIYGLLAFFMVMMAIGYNSWLWIGVPVLLFFFFWLKAWLHANDKLKKAIYPELLEDHLIAKKIIVVPFISKRFIPDVDYITCVSNNGEEQIYKVDFIHEQSALYVVKIYVSQIQQRCAQ